MRQRRVIPIDRIREVLDYDPHTGRFYWRCKTTDKVVIGREAGNATGRRDVRISVDGVLYQAHRLAWVLMTGEQPPPLIDHVDMNTRNNRWGNLRPASTSSNGANRQMQTNNTSGVKGVYYYEGKKSPWLARLSCEGEIKLNKRFKTKEEARAAYEAAALKHFGKFART